mmetsp:Transcript_66885/g.151080  ORF Transcript_66885/g.151080 Transcript_66885/m.151080 type:complete len:110 (-) Transcript_66885:295-624(-)
MGGEASRPVKQASNLIRRAGDPLNTLSYPVVHEKVVLPPTPGKPVRVTICRCWQSLKFPLCDNTHQRLQKQGCNIGPVMLEIKTGPTKVGAVPLGTAAGGAPPRPTGWQ